MGLRFSAAKIEMLEEERRSSIKLTKVDRKSAEKIFKIIRDESDGCLAGNLTMSQGVRASQLISSIKEKIIYN